MKSTASKSDILYQEYDLTAEYSIWSFYTLLFQRNRDHLLAFSYGGAAFFSNKIKRLIFALIIRLKRGLYSLSFSFFLILSVVLFFLNVETAAISNKITCKLEDGPMHLQFLMKYLKHCLFLYCLFIPKVQIHPDPWYDFTQHKNILNKNVFIDTLCFSYLLVVWFYQFWLSSLGM